MHTDAHGCTRISGLNIKKSVWFRVIPLSNGTAPSFSYLDKLIKISYFMFHKI